MVTEKVNALDILATLGTKPKEAKPKASKSKSPKKRKKRTILVFDEKTVRLLSLKFLNKRFEFQLKASPKLTEAKYFELLNQKVPMVQLTESKIHFCDVKKEKIASVNFKPLKRKYKNLLIEVIKKQTVGSDGIISAPKVVTAIMKYCQTAYVKGNDEDRKLMIFRPEKVTDGKMGESIHFLNQ